MATWTKRRWRWELNSSFLSIFYIYLLAVFCHRWGLDMKDRPWVFSSTCTRLKFLYFGALFCFRNCTTQPRLCLPIRYGLFFSQPPLQRSPFYGSTTSNSCLGRETNCVCNHFQLWCDMGSQFPPSASRVDQWIVCVSSLFPILWQYNK